MQKLLKRKKLVFSFLVGWFLILTCLDVHGFQNFRDDPDAQLTIGPRIREERWGGGLLHPCEGYFIFLVLFGLSGLLSEVRDGLVSDKSTFGSWDSNPRRLLFAWKKICHDFQAIKESQSNQSGLQFFDAIAFCRPTLISLCVNVHRRCDPLTLEVERWRLSDGGIRLSPWNPVEKRETAK